MNKRFASLNGQTPAGQREMVERAKVKLAEEVEASAGWRTVLDAAELVARCFDVDEAARLATVPRAGRVRAGGGATRRRPRRLGRASCRPLPMDRP